MQNEQILEIRYCHIPERLQYEEDLNWEKGKVLKNWQ